MKHAKWKLLTALLLIAALAFATACAQEPAATEPTEAPAGDGWTVTFFDSDGVSVLQEVSVAGRCDGGKARAHTRRLCGQGLLRDARAADPV